jgi:L-ascorbate metabolism protein UlaG (beta-lactamase superfamily)
MQRFARLRVLNEFHSPARDLVLTADGPRRLSPPGLASEDLPRIDVVLISHDHYDHLDRNTVKRLAAARGPLFLVPLRLKAWFSQKKHIQAVQNSLP